jgi:sporulation protein YlmC with PRC-barrel domain
MKLFFVTAASSVALALVLTCPLASSAASEGAPLEAPPSELPTMRVDELIGAKVLDDAGEELGDVDSIVRDRVTKKLYAVVAVGGVLGIGEHDVTIALEDLTREGKHLVAPPGTTRDRLEDMPEYDEERFDELPGDQVVTVGARAGRHGGGSR